MPLGFVVILIVPPPDWLASVVTELFVIANWLPALIWMLPVLPGPVLPAVIVAPLVMVTVFGASIVIVPPVADGAVPDVAADRLPLSCKVTEFELTEMFLPRRCFLYR